MISQNIIIEKNEADAKLRNIHFRRLKNEIISIDDSVFLYDNYLRTNDVRYLNELLWLKNKNNIDLALTHFHTNLNDKKQHKYFYNDDLKGCLKTASDHIKVKKQDFENKKICLIGLPFHFLIGFKKLRKFKADVAIVNIAYHPNRKTHLLLNNKITNLFYKIYFGKKRYKVISIQHKSELKEIELDNKYDIGFHKLSFIISEQLINQFKHGLINDHWGALPLFKGRSTLDYSRLFGAELIITNHLIHKEIDAGPILLYSKIDRNKLKKSIYYQLGGRIVKSIALLCKNDFKNIDNSKGEMFFEMHPFLKEHIKTNKL